MTFRNIPLLVFSVIVALVLCLGCGAGAQDTGTIRPVDRATPPEDPTDHATTDHEHPLFPRAPGMEEPTQPEEPEPAESE